jgi:hypothetical protein|tara:strand:- start:297 stop:770 length:474 start_codon:yes stop_codon:yes gene_type:complete
MSDKVYLPMDPNKRDELRYAMETQFRYKFYNSTEFPFLPSMGIRHIFQSFEIKEVFEYIGMLHLWWTNEDNGIVYDNPRNFVKGTWHGVWYDRPQEGIERANELQKNDCIDLEKLYQVHLNYHNDLQKKKTKDAIEKHVRETLELDDSLPDKKTLLN